MSVSISVYVRELTVLDNCVETWMWCRLAFKKYDMMPLGSCMHVSRSASGGNAFRALERVQYVIVHSISISTSRQNTVSVTVELNDNELSVNL